MHIFGHISRAVMMRRWRLLEMAYYFSGAMTRCGCAAIALLRRHRHKVTTRTHEYAIK